MRVFLTERPVVRMSACICLSCGGCEECVFRRVAKACLVMVNDDDGVGGGSPCVADVCADRVEK